MKSIRSSEDDVFSSRGSVQKKRGIAHCFAAVSYSVAGLRIAIRETAVRQEILLGVAHCVLLAIFDMTLLMGLFLSALWFVVLIVEILNTALEFVVNLASPGFHSLAGHAKDLGSAAVFCALVLFVLSWTVVIVWHCIGVCE